MMNNRLSYQDVVALVENGDLISLDDLIMNHPELGFTELRNAVLRGDIDEPVRKNNMVYFWHDQILDFLRNASNPTTNAWDAFLRTMNKDAEKSLN